MRTLNRIIGNSAIGNYIVKHGYDGKFYVMFFTIKNFKVFKFYFKPLCKEQDFAVKYWQE